MANGSTQFDVAFFGLQAGHHDAAANDIATKLQQASDGGWKIAWMLTTTEGIVMVLERPTPVPPTPKSSLGGYGSPGGGTA